ncbi:MAG: Gfo/Idh/MocA family oxidoreductase [Geminicoccales bacterium]
MQQKKLNVGVIGTGAMGSRHAHNLAHRTPTADVVAIMDVDEVRASEVAAACGRATIYNDGNALIGDEAVEAVVIASPDQTHADLAIACIEAGKPVLCEKPLGVTLDDAARVLKAEAAHGARLVQVGLMRIYDPYHVMIKEAIERGAIGRPVLFRGIHKNVAFPQARTAEDVIVNSGVHDIHSARWLMGDEVVSVHADHVIDLPERPETARLTLLQLRFRQGGLATIEVDADSHYGYDVRVEISGERGTLETPDADVSAVHFQDGKASRLVNQEWLARFESAYRLEAEAWVDVAARGTAAGASVWDGYAAMCVADAAIRSLTSGRAEVVNAEPRPSLYDPIA